MTTPNKFTCRGCKAESSALLAAFGSIDFEDLPVGGWTSTLVFPKNLPSPEFRAYHKCSDSTIALVDSSNPIDPATDFDASLGIAGASLGIAGASLGIAGGLKTAPPSPFPTGAAYSESLLSGDDPMTALQKAGIPAIIEALGSQTRKAEASVRADRAVEASNWLDAAERAKSLGNTKLYKQAITNAEAAICFRKAKKK